MLVLNTLFLLSYRSLANGSMKMPSREFSWKTMKGITENLLMKVGFLRNYALKQARSKVMELTNGVYPAPLKILEVSFIVLTVTKIAVCHFTVFGKSCTSAHEPVYTIAVHSL